MNRIRVLLVAGDYWHPAEVIRKGLAAFGSRLSVFDIDTVEDAKDILTEDMLREYDVCVCAKSNEISSSNREPWFEEGVTEVTPSVLRTWIEEGHGFLAVHAGNSFFSEDKGIPVFDQPNRAYIDLVGNSFDSHPPRCPVTYSPVKKHPVLEGVEPFTERDEHYHLKTLADDRDEFLISESLTGGRQTAGYERRIGRGKLIVLTPGHTLSVWKNESFQILFTNTIKYLAGAAI